MLKNLWTEKCAFPSKGFLCNFFAYFMAFMAFFVTITALCYGIFWHIKDLFGQISGISPSLCPAGALQSKKRLPDRHSLS